MSEEQAKRTFNNEMRAECGIEANQSASRGADSDRKRGGNPQGPGSLLLSQLGRQVISSARVGICLYDLDLRYVMWNPFLQEMFGVPAEKVLGKHDSELFPFVKEQGLDELMKKALAGERAACPDFTYFVPGSGQAGWGSSTYEPLRNSSGEIAGVLATVKDITQLKLAQQGLRQSEERYRTVVERAADVIYMISPDCGIISLNQAFERLTGWKRADWIGRSLLTMLHPDDAPAAAELFQRVARGESVPPFELRFISQNGEHLVGECTAAPQLERGRVVSVSGIVRDITARKRADEALRASNERFELIVQATNDAVWDWNVITGKVWWSESVRTLFGYEAEDAGSEASRWHDHIHPDDRDRVVSGVHRVVAGGGQSWFDEYRYQRSNGSYAYVLDRGFVSRAEDGTALRMIGAMMDVTYRKSAEEALQRAEEKYRSIFENAFEGIFQSTHDGRFIAVNPALAQMLGYDSTQDLIRSITDIQTQLYTDTGRRSEFQRLLEEQGTVQRFENQVYRKDRSVMWISESGRAVRNAAGDILFYEGAIEDITSLKQAEAARLRLEEQLLRAQRIESIGRLAGGVAHDFNNLLTAIIGYGQLVEERLGTGHALGPEVKQIIDAGHRAAALTRQLLAFSRRQNLIAQTINLNDALSNLMNMLRRIIGEDVDLRFRPATDLSSVLADAGQIEQVIMNLAVNARDAMPEGGRLIIGTRNVTLDEAYCRENLWARPGKYAEIAVSDAGVGMDPEIQRQIFEPFFTTKQVGKGTGLGLAVVYGIIKQHDGLIDVYSAPGHGTSVKVYLKAQGTVVCDQACEPETGVQGGSETVLVAEDELTLRNLAKIVLENLGYKVLLASDGQEAVAAYEAAMGEIDLVILDLVMPRMGGRDAYEKIRALGGECPVIFVTGYAPEIVELEIPGSSSSDFVQKPYEVNELGRIVRETLDSRARKR